jgi:hypothetical protein
LDTSNGFFTVHDEVVSRFRFLKASGFTMTSVASVASVSLSHYWSALGH